jgi:hypothetical protein
VAGSRSSAEPSLARAASATTPNASPATRPRPTARTASGSRLTATPAAARAATHASNASRNPSGTAAEDSAPAESPSSPRPRHTAATAVHWVRPNRACSTGTATTAVTARLPASAACTTKIGTVRRAQYCAKKPSASRASPARNGTCRSVRISTAGSTFSEVGVRRAPTACRTEATP